MAGIDQRIRDALGDTGLPPDYDPSSEESLFQQTLVVMRGRQRWFVMIVMAVSIAFLALAVYSIVRFFRASEVADLVMWSTVFLFSQLVVMMLKLWVWLQMNKNEVKREVKRLELEIARLAERASA